MEIITRVELNCNTEGYQDTESVAYALEEVAKAIREGCRWGIVGCSLDSWSVDIDYTDDEEDEEKVWFESRDFVINKEEGDDD